jgi:predicted Fe-S protein YdhL (DUF1289 family)
MNNSLSFSHLNILNAVLERVKKYNRKPVINLSELNMYQSKDHVQSHCIESCILNDKKFCLGCFRSLGEIVQWQEMDDKMRREVLLKTERRRKECDFERSEQTRISLSDKTG